MLPSTHCRCWALQKTYLLHNEFFFKLTPSSRYCMSSEGIPSGAALSRQPSIDVEKAKAKLHAKKTARRPLAKSTSQKLSEKSKERAVPSSRVSRLVNYGTLVAGLGVGTINQGIKKQLGLVENTHGNVGTVLSEANIERIVETLCKVRGAALKLGQMFSIQDDSLMPPELAQAFDRVRSNADFMPKWQLESVMKQELGSDWLHKHFKHFDMKPFAAASIGQVHQGVMHDDRVVAVKVQYPGVAESIDSDINSLLSLLSLSKLLPDGLFLEEVADVARRELTWEVDYVREANSCAKFRELLADDDNYFVAEHIPALSTERILTTELIQGVPLDAVQDMDQDTRNNVSMWILQLVLKELFEFKFMQTDPNWSNFLYNKDTNQVCLLDFGASRGYAKNFIDAYIDVIHGAATGDRNKVDRMLTKLGFHTGYESKTFVQANIDAVMVLGEPFSQEGDYDFTQQDITLRIQQIVNYSYIADRLKPPPDESYSLHRKLAGAFLLATKLGAKMNCYDAFHSVYNSYNFG